MAELASTVDRRASDGLPVIVHGAPGREPTPEDPVQAPLTAAGDAARGSDDGEASRHEDRHP